MTRALPIPQQGAARRATTLLERIDYQATLSKQLPIPSLRIVYNRSGMRVCAAKLRDKRAIVTSGLYWAAAVSEAPNRT